MQGASAEGQREKRERGETDREEGQWGQTGRGEGARIAQWVPDPHWKQSLVPKGPSGWCEVSLMQTRDRASWTLGSGCRLNSGWRQELARHPCSSSQHPEPPGCRPSQRTSGGAHHDKGVADPERGPASWALRDLDGLTVHGHHHGWGLAHRAPGTDREQRKEHESRGHLRSPHGRASGAFQIAQSPAGPVCRTTCPGHLNLCQSRSREEASLLPGIRAQRGETQDIRSLARPPVPGWTQQF